MCRGWPFIAAEVPLVWAGREEVAAAAAACRMPFVVDECVGWGAEEAAAADGGGESSMTMISLGGPFR